MLPKTIQTQSEIAIMATLAFILDRIVLFQLPQGGAISLAMLPIILLGLRRGLGASLSAGLILGLLQCFIGGYFLQPFQVLLDYAVAYMALGLAGLFQNPFKAATSRGKIGYLLLATLLATSCRFLAHFLAGILFYASYAPKGSPVWLYSLLYNASYLVPSGFLTLLLLILLLRLQPKLFDHR